VQRAVRANALTARVAAGATLRLPRPSNRLVSRLSRPILAVAVVAAVMLPGISLPATLRTKPKPVRTALTARYAEVVDAYRRRDVEAALAVRAPDFYAVQASGETWDAARSAAYVRAGFAQVESTLALTFDLGIIDVHGDTAAAEVDQHWLRRQVKAGQPRLVDTRAHQRETWLRRGGKWWLWRVDRVRPGAWHVDGKRIDPSKPFDPNAPPYEPPTGP
jgi:ketosteroid isomerase-like protein